MRKFNQNSKIGKILSDTCTSEPQKRAITPGITTQTSSEDVSSIKSLLVPRTLNFIIRPGYTICKYTNFQDP